MAKCRSPNRLHLIWQKDLFQSVTTDKCTFADIRQTGGKLYFRQSCLIAEQRIAEHCHTVRHHCGFQSDFCGNCHSVGEHCHIICLVLQPRGPLQDTGAGTGDPAAALYSFQSRTAAKRTAAYGGHAVRYRHAFQGGFLLKCRFGNCSHRIPVDTGRNVQHREIPLHAGNHSISRIICLIIDTVE